MAAERLVEDRFDKVVPTDASIFADLYPRLRRFAAVVGPIEVDPDDLVQDALERTLKRQSLSSLENPRAYLSKTILNLASNHRRGLGRARRARSRLHTDEAAQQTYPSDVTELLRLPPQQRAILFLGAIEGFTNAEIAGQLSMTEAAVTKASQRARQKLSAELREEMK